MEFLTSLESIYCQAFKNILVDGSHNYFVIILCIKKIIKMKHRMISKPPAQGSTLVLL